MPARIVAELGRPETPQEAADRKAESSRIYRSSQTMRNLVAALVATVAVVVLVVMISPRAQAPTRGPIDVSARAAEVAAGLNRDIVAPALPAGWTVNAAAVSGNNPPVWTIVAVPPGDGYLRVSQALDADAVWDARILPAEQATGTITLSGIEWIEYVPDRPQAAGNIAYALVTQAGPDRIMVYGTADQTDIREVADLLADDVASLRGADQ